MIHKGVSTNKAAKSMITKSVWMHRSNIYYYRKYIKVGRLKAMGANACFAVYVCKLKLFKTIKNIKKQLSA